MEPNKNIAKVQNPTVPIREPKNTSIPIPKIDTAKIQDKLKNDAKYIGLSEKQKQVKIKQEQNLINVNSRIKDKTKKVFDIKPGKNTATGLEKVIFISGDAILKAQFAIDDLFYGKFQYEGNNKFKKAIDKGVVNVLNDISEIDLCQILNYALEKVPGSKSFDPEVVPKDPLGLAKYNVQKAAYDVQLKIDGFHSSYLESDNNETKAKGVYDIIKEIRESFKEINDPEAQSALRDPRLLSAFPQMGPVNSFLEKAFGDFNRYTDYRQIPSSDLQNLITKIEKIRAYTILLQGMNTPANAIGFIDSVFPNANIQELIQKIEKIVDPARLMPLLKNIVESLKKVQSICNVFVSFVTTAQGIIKIVTLLVKVFKIIVKFLQALPIPGTFTVLGITIKFGSFTENTLRKLDDLIDRLSQINILLSLCVNLFRDLSVILYDIIAKINRMLASLEACSNADPKIIKDLQDARDGLQKTADYFTKFVNNHDSKTNVNESTFGDFTIQIVTEEVVDDAITLRRRYGIATKVNGTIVAQSDPTFASDNLIIINEVKAILAAKGFIKQDPYALSPYETGVISQSLSYLLDDNISLNDIESVNFSDGLDSGNNENENDELGLNAFMNKLQGGKKLRERMRKMVKKNADQLQTDLANSGTGVKLNTSNLPGQKDNSASNQELDNLKKQKTELEQKAAASKSKIQRKAYEVQIKDIDKKIAKLENE